MQFRLLRCIVKGIPTHLALCIGGGVMFPALAPMSETKGIGEDGEIERLGPYRIEAECGRGGMSVVYSAVHDLLKTRHAVKVFDVPECANADILRGKFLAEARILATLRHPNIVRVTDYGTASDGRPWLAMDFVEGETLAIRLAGANPPTPEEAAGLYRDIRSALAYCHLRGIVHGDLKAENILLRSDGHAVLSDFGIARIVNPKMRERLELTGSCEAGGFGTAYALAPECRDGASATPCADVYSLGVVMFKVVTGIWYEGSPRLMEQLKTFAPKWEQTLSRMLEPDPSKRPENADVLPENPAEKDSSFCSGRVALVATTAVAFVLVCTFALMGGWHTSGDRLLGLLRSDDASTAAASVPKVVSLPSGRISLRTAMHVRRLALPPYDGVAEIAIPEDLSGILISADEVDGYMPDQIRVLPQPGMRVLYRGNKEVVIKRK